jgi:peptide/nickel transport system substrate-binding protein
MGRKHKTGLAEKTSCIKKETQRNHLPYLETVAITFLPDKQSGFHLVIQGKLDFTSGWTLLIKTEILTQNCSLIT